MSRKKVELIPYTIHLVVENTNEAPEGLVQAPAIWDDHSQVEGIGNLDIALQALKLNQKRIKNEEEYYDEEQDKKIIKDYYYRIDFFNVDKKELYKQLNQLITSTHENQLPYNAKTRDYLYSRVDLHKDGKLKSIYCGKEKDPEQVMREDYEMERKRTEAYAKLLKSGKIDSEIQRAMTSIESEYMYNTEHVVPQSWFGKDNPMRGDLHHLFTCE